MGSDSDSRPGLLAPIRILKNLMWIFPILVFFPSKTVNFNIKLIEIECFSGKYQWISSPKPVQKCIKELPKVTSTCKKDGNTKESVWGMGF